VTGGAERFVNTPEDDSDRLFRGFANTGSSQGYVSEPSLLPSRAFRTPRG
jgi:hypothetical protein